MSPEAEDLARKRMLDPKIWESEQVMGLPAEAFKLYIYCINHADDEGRMSVSYPMMKSRCFPINNKITVQTVEKHLIMMAEVGLIWLYEVDNLWYLAHPNWLVYQTINHPTDSKLPPLPEDYRSPTVVIPPNLIKVKLSKDNITSGVEKQIDEVFEYFRQKTGSKVRSTTEALRSVIRARLNDGYTVEECKRAIAFVYTDKKDNPDQAKYIRIDTIFRPSLFAGYLDAQLRYSGEAK